MVSTRRYTAWLIWLILGASGTVIAGERESTGPATNLQLFQTLAGRIAFAAVPDTVPGDSATMALTVLPKESGWLIEDAVFQAATKHGFHLTMSPQASFTGEFGIIEMKVSYSNLRRTGLFGSRIIDRTVRLVLHAKVLDRRAGRVLTLADSVDESTDTIELSDIEKVENPTLSVTRGILPPEGFFSNFAEPIIVLGAVAVAVYLLFNVRS